MARNIPLNLVQAFIAESAARREHSAFEPRGMKTPRILIANAARHHSHQAALALLEAGFLGCYATGVPVLRNSLVHRLSSYEEIPILGELTRVNMVNRISNRFIRRYLPAFLGEPIYYQTFRMFDRWVARLVASDNFDAVIAYENSAICTFRAANNAGAKCILDAADLHHIDQDRYHESEFARIKARVNNSKDAEIDLADCIFTVSEFAANSYRVNIDPDKSIKVIPLGVDLDRFKPDSNPRIAFTFAFVGAGTQVKGFDIVLDAMNILISEGHVFKFVMAGGIDQSLFAGRTNLEEKICNFGVINQQQLLSVYRSADCLLLPSRRESFGMVVAEAMACGVPTIVSDTVGAKELVEEGRNGFIVPTGNRDALVDRMRWCILNAAAVRSMSLAARAAAERYSWANYRRRLVTAVCEVLQKPKALNPTPIDE
jgi:glycosyltransferase involved in cell wall biosynthesis